MIQLSDKEIEKIYQETWEQVCSEKLDRELTNSEKEIVSLCRNNFNKVPHPNSVAYRIIEAKIDENAKNWTPDFESVMSVSELSMMGSILSKKIRDFLLEKNLVTRGYDLKTGQIILAVCFDQNKPFENQLSILEAVPYIRSGVISIFDHELSKFETRDIHFEEDGYSVKSHRKEYFKSKDIKQVLKYVYDRFPYILEGKE